ncbi:MAG: hypothetical protein IKN17_13720, partial [Ruminococcus sp.]|nr:hypothetical protein [Ruminococcus sp.]
IRRNQKTGFDNQLPPGTPAKALPAVRPGEKCGTSEIKGGIKKRALITSCPTELPPKPCPPSDRVRSAEQVR